MILEWMEQAQTDLRSIVEYISEDDPTAAFVLVDAITESTQSILTDHPNVGRRGRVEGTREWVAHKSYVVVYRVQGDRVQVLSVIHSARLWPSSL